MAQRYLEKARAYTTVDKSDLPKRSIDAGTPEPACDKSDESDERVDDAPALAVFDLAADLNFLESGIGETTAGPGAERWIAWIVAHQRDGLLPRAHDLLTKIAAARNTPPMKPDLPATSRSRRERMRSRTKTPMRSPRRRGMRSRRR